MPPFQPDLQEAKMARSSFNAPHQGVMVLATLQGIMLPIEVYQAVHEQINLKPGPKMVNQNP